MFRPVAALFALLLVLAPALALADDWSADRLRGRVLQLVDGGWQPLTRGMVVPDSRVVRTLATGHVTFVRGEEAVELGPNTQIQIYDRAGRKPFTTVKQYFGSVSVEAQVENVQHFAVETPFLAAVVKGTRFVVTSTRTGSSVRVRRGHVAVEDKANKSHVTLSVGQSATVDLRKTHGEIAVSGSGKLPPVEGGDPGPGKSSGAEGDGAANGLHLGIGNSGHHGSLVDLGIGGSNGHDDLVDLSVGGKGLVNLSIGGSGKSGRSAGDDSGSGGSNSGHGSSGGGGTSGTDGGGGKLLNLNLGGIHLGL